jgi:HTH-type transcriptional regulator / antitoxin HigA
LAGHPLTEVQSDYFDLLSSLIETYEREHVPPSKASGLDALRHLVNEHGMSGADLSRLLGAHRTLGAMILRGERKLTIQHVRTLSKHFGISAELFLTE